MQYERGSDSSTQNEREEKRREGMEREEERREGKEKEKEGKKSIKLDKIIKSNHCKALDILTPSYRSLLILPFI